MRISFVKQSAGSKRTWGVDGVVIVLNWDWRQSAMRRKRRI
jgi:hypothetical protein